MPLNLPSYSDIVERSRADLKSALSGLDPTIFESLVMGIVEAASGRHLDNTLSIKQLVKELFPDTAIFENLERWAIYDGVIPLTEDQSAGSAVFTGVVGTTIPINRIFKAVNGNTYIAQESVDISLKEISITSLTRSGTTVTAQTSSNHGFATNLTVTIAGAVETDYNGAVPIVVTDVDVFTYEIATTPTTPATGTITAACNCAEVPLNSEETGLNKNLDSGATLTLVSKLTDVDDDGYVNFAAVTGGTDPETKESLLRRTKQQRANPVANFNIGAIGKKALEVDGVTRLKVKRVTPDIGQVTILFVKDGKDNIIPTAAEVTEVKNSILEILQASSEESDVIVTAPTPVSTNYTFSSISPDSPSMQTAIQNSLIAFYEDAVTFETNITEDQYRSAIIETVDSETGLKLQSFTLSTPTTDITVGTDSIGILGTVSF